MAVRSFARSFGGFLSFGRDWGDNFWFILLVLAIFVPLHMLLSGPDKRWVSTVQALDRKITGHTRQPTTTLCFAPLQQFHTKGNTLLMRWLWFWHMLQRCCGVHKNTCVYVIWAFVVVGTVFLLVLFGAILEANSDVIWLIVPSGNACSNRVSCTVYIDAAIDHTTHTDILSR